MTGVGTLTLAEITAEVREVNIAKGWRSPGGGICEGQTFGDYIALLLSEMSEALEAYRDHRLADATGEWPELDPRDDSVCPPKPEGVGSEFADELIRLVDMDEAWGIGSLPLALTLDEVPDLYSDPLFVLRSFGDHLAWISFHIAQAWPSPEIELPVVLRALVTTARRYGIDLEAEYRRKIAYNRTRQFQHGGRTLAGDK